MPDVLGIALGLAPLAQDAIQAAVRKNAGATLMKLVEKDLRRSHRVPPVQRENAANAWSRQHIDPELLGYLTAWSATGDEQFLAGAGARWRNLLANDLDPMQVVRLRRSPLRKRPKRA